MDSMAAERLRMRDERRGPKSPPHWLSANYFARPALGGQLTPTPP